MKYVFFHSDLDGYVGGAILRTKYPNHKYIECNYDNRIKPLDFLKPGDEVIIVDYSFLPEEMKWLKECCQIIWLDHHISAIRDSIQHGYDSLNGIRKVGISGAEIAWKWVYPEGSLPKFVKLVGEYDTFRNAYTKFFDTEVIPFFFGAETFLPGLNPLNFGKETYLFDLKNLSGLTKKFVNVGLVIFHHEKAVCAKINHDSAYVRNLWGLRVLCLNTSAVGSLCLTVPKTYDPEKHDMMLTYSYNGKRWTYGFYTDDQRHPEVDCSAIAKRYGGGGHPGAAGCTTTKLLEELC